MISIVKLTRLPELTRLRKIERLFHEHSIELSRQHAIDRNYITSLCLALAEDPSEMPIQSIRERAFALVKMFEKSDMCQVAWYCADISMMLSEVLHIDHADWDMVDQTTGALDKTSRLIYPINVVMDRIRSPFNVGSMFRTSDSFGVRSILLLQPTADPMHPRAQRSARGCTETVAWEQLSFEAIKARIGTAPIFALETRGTALHEFKFPKEGYVVVGSEELGTSPQMLELADSSLGRVTIPMAGTKGSLNVSVAFGIMMQKWFASYAR